MSGRIIELLQVPARAHDLDWLKQGLQAAVELELATIPPYLCGLWSIKSGAGPVFDLIESVVLEEMLHMGLACNMLTGIGGTPAVVAGYRNIAYPGPLPGGVRPDVTVYLAGLKKDYIESVYMEIEFPESGPIALEETFATIGAFYDALSAAFTTVNVPISTNRQLVSPGVGLTKLTTVADVVNAIKQIKEQGEGTSQSPDAVDFGGELAHYYRFSEIVRGRKLIQEADKRVYKGDMIPFPEVYAFAPIPKGGYVNPPAAAQQALQAFDQKFAELLGDLDRAWAAGDQSSLSKGVGAMRELQPLASALMQIARPDQPGTAYGPDFRVS